MRTTGLAAGLALALIGGAALAACPADAPEGLFQGAFGAAGPDRTELTLNLVCDRGVYSGQLLSSLRDVRATDAGSGAGRARLSLENGGMVDLTLAGEMLSGSFRLAWLSGPLKLARVGPPLPAGGLRPTRGIERSGGDVHAAPAPSRRVT